MKLYPIANPRCRCEADVTVESAVLRVPRGMPRQLKAAKQIHHYRKRDQAHFWHWSDQDVVQI